MRGGFTGPRNPITETQEEPDEISDLVDWQLSKRSIIDNSMWTCHKCRCRWQSGPMRCPECGERKRN